VDLAVLGRTRVGEMEVEVIDPVATHADLMETLFDFGAIRRLLGSGHFRMRFDAMHAVTGPYGHEVLEGGWARRRQRRQRRAAARLRRRAPRPEPDLCRRPGGHDVGRRRPDFGAASDGDGDRNMIVGRRFIVTPSDSLAVLAANATSCRVTPAA
jgi:phosphoglucomutase